MSKNDRLYNTTISFIFGIASTIFGIIVIVFNKSFYIHTINILLILVLINGIKDIIKKIFRKKNNINFLFTFLSMIFALVLLFLPKIPQSFFPRFFSSYLLMCSVFNILMFIILLRNNVNSRYTYLFKAIFLSIIGIIIFFSPLKYVYILLIVMGVYFIVLGLSFIITSVYRLIPVKYKNIYKRNIRVSLPVWLEAIVPYTVLVEINKFLKIEDNKKKLSSEKIIDKPDIEVMVHVSDNGFNRVGHVDLIYNGKVISYGNYDDKSKTLFTTIGDGVLFYADKKKYIPFCIKHSKKILFCYGIKLTNKQKEIIEKKLNHLKEQLIVWNPPCPSNKKKLKDLDYASALYKATGAELYKFKNGKFKTYFLFGSSCCHLANEIIGYSGIDVLRMNGIICPGTYYDCLNREYISKNGLVISRYIYTKDTYKDLLKEE